MSIKKLFIICCILPIAYCQLLIAQSCQDASIQLTATVQSNPASITLNWLNNGNATQYSVYRKLKSDPSWTNFLASLPSGANQYIDTSVQVGVSYEYHVGGYFSGYSADGYINAGIEIGAIEDRGIMILMVDSMFTSPLAVGITGLVSDLEGDGWKVVRHDVSRNASVPSIKNLIVTDYNANPTNVKAVFLFGHVPVPYSGNINPDGHPDHEGAWSADMFYADVDGVWTDVSVNNTVASAVRNQNVPGDGKYDQSYLPSNVELQIARVDFYDLPAFAASETQLMQNYLDKDHDYKHKNFTVNRLGLVDDNFGYFGGEAFAANGWKNFSPLVGTANVSGNDYFTTMANSSFLWSYGCGGGTYTSAGGVGSTYDFAISNLQTVFTILFGSYFGDWDTQNNFLRAPLAQGKTLTNCWAGRPHWALHHMALGENIGYSTMISQNNSGVYFYNYGERMVHIALMGDPSLRNDVIAPPSNIVATLAGTNTTITWTASADTVLGYYIYEKQDAGDYIRITNTPIVGTSYTHPCVIDSGLYTYMVRAVELEIIPSGTYYNLSQGISDTAFQSMNMGVNASFYYTNSCNDVSFTNTSLGTFSSIWDFGDSNNSTSNSPQHTYTNAGAYNITLIIYDACSSDTMMLPVTIAPAITSSQNVTICAGETITVGTNTYTISGTYTDVLTAINGCDSTVTTALTVENTIDVSTTVNGFVISAVNNANANYQWIDCNNGNSPISGATSSVYSPSVNGQYAVVVTVNSCADTSTCVNITTVAIKDNVGDAFAIYPNPTKGKVTIETGNVIADKIWITDALGKRVWEMNPTINKTDCVLPKKGFFFVFMEYEGKSISLGKVSVE